MRGAEIGAPSITARSDFAYPFVTSRTSRALASAAEVREAHSGCLFLCDGRR